MIFRNDARSYILLVLNVEKLILQYGNDQNKS